MRPSTAHNFTFTFPVEDTYNHKDYQMWMKKNWPLSIVCAIIYIIAIFGMQHFMKGRNKFELRIPLVIWNITLAVPSFIGAARLIAETATMLTHDGFYYTICYAALLERNRVCCFWVWIMTVSKVVELGDTFFIVLRKQKLIFLHWYHHISVLIYTWFTFSQIPSTGRWFVLMNFTVHAVMYSYYALKAMKFNPSKKIAMLITIMQLAQMVMGCYVNVRAKQLIENGVECHTPLVNVNMALVLYASYFVLFMKFFYNAYISGNKDTSNREKIKST